MSQRQTPQQQSHWRDTPYDVERIPLDHFYLPAMPPIGLLRAVVGWFRAWRRRRESRALMKLDDHLLGDLGHRREDLLASARSPLHRYAAEALARRRRRRQRQDEDGPACENEP